MIKKNKIIIFIGVSFFRCVYMVQDMPYSITSPCGGYSISVTQENDCINVVENRSGECVAQMQEVLPGTCGVWCSPNTFCPDCFFVIVNDYETRHPERDWVRAVVLNFDKKLKQLSIVTPITCIPSDERFEHLAVYNGTFLECRTGSGRIYRVSLRSPNVFRIINVPSRRQLKEIKRRREYDIHAIFSLPPKPVVF